MPCICIKMLGRMELETSGLVGLGLVELEVNMIEK
jgi:hypothetical protein